MAAVGIRRVVRARRRAVAPVVGTIMMVAITIVLASVVFYLVSSMITPPPPTPTSITFASFGWRDGNNNASVTTASGVSGMSASGVGYIVRDPEGTPYFSGKADETQTVNNVSVTVRYNDLNGDDRINPGDIISIEVSPISASAALEGGILEMHHSGRQIASHGL